MKNVKMSKVFVTPYNYVSKPVNQVFEPSKTVPSQVLSVREIMNRFTRGVGVPARREVYDEDVYLPDYNSLDLTEREDMYEAARQEIASLKAEREAQAAKAREPLAAKEPKVEPVRRSDGDVAQRNKPSEGDSSTGD